MASLDELTFLRRISEAARWCGHQLRSVNPTLRSEELRPARELIFESGANLSGSAFREFYRDQVRLIGAEVDALVLRRHTLLRDLETGEDKSGNGRLLLFSPFYSTGDTLAHFESEKFFDLNDVPPWDTFVTYWFDPEMEEGRDGARRENGIICWIPNAFVGLADAGVRVSICTLSWIDISNERVSRELKHLVEIWERNRARSGCSGPHACSGS